MRGVTGYWDSASKSLDTTKAWDWREDSVWGTTNSQRRDQTTEARSDPATKWWTSNGKKSSWDASEVHAWDYKEDCYGGSVNQEGREMNTVLNASHTGRWRASRDSAPNADRNAGWEGTSTESSTKGKDWWSSATENESSDTTKAWDWREDSAWGTTNYDRCQNGRTAAAHRWSSGREDDISESARAWGSESDGKKWGVCKKSDGFTAMDSSYFPSRSADWGTRKDDSWSVRPTEWWSTKDDESRNNNDRAPTLSVQDQRAISIQMQREILDAARDFRALVILVNRFCIANSILLVALSSLS